jgi:small subunit ribosomal protein S4
MTALAPVLANTKTVDWVSLNPETFSGKVLSAPNREQIDSSINSQLIVEHYSR